MTPVSYSSASWNLAAWVICAALLASAQARPVLISGVPTRPVIETKPLSGGREGLPIWFLPQLGLETRNNPQDVWLSYGPRSLRYTADTGWIASGFSLSGPLPAPERYPVGGSLHISLEVLRALGVPLGGTAAQLDVSVRRAGVEAPLPPTARVSPTPAPSTGQPSAGQPAAGQPAAAPRPSASRPPIQAQPVYSKPVQSQPVQGLAAPPQSGAGQSPAGQSVAGQIDRAISAALSPSPAAELAPTASSLPPLSGSALVPFAPAPVPSAPPTTALGGPRITGVRSSLSMVRTIQLQRLVLDLSGPAAYRAQNERGGVTIFVPGAQASPSVQTLESGDILTFAPSEQGVTVRLDAGGGSSQVMSLDNPDRIVIDTARSLSTDVPPPIKEDALPDGVSLKVLGGLSLLSFDPARYLPHVVTAPLGQALNVAELVRQGGGVAGVNGGYFDPPSSLPVDFVAVGGKLLAPSLERRGTVGFNASGAALFGFPRPRYTLTGAFGTLNVNTVTARFAPGLLSAFVGDGKTAVGGPGLTTLTLNSGADRVIRADGNGSIPAQGLISLTFDPVRYPQLPRTPGSELQAALNYQLPDWQGIREGLSAGPMLIQGGQIVLDPQREAFNVLTSVWRPTRQVAYAVYRGQPTLAFLDYGTPDTFARALKSAGVQDALRLDSGSSATVFVSGGYLGTGGYLNSVWSRPVPNAIVLVPTDAAALKGGQQAK